MKISQQIEVIQPYHGIEFSAGDINKVVPFNREMLTAYFIPECSERDYFKGKCKENPREDCKYCNHGFKHEELLVDGFYVQDDSYIAYLQKGIRVPVPKVIYDEYIKGFEKDST